jgi:putative methionine-R-sulfoxide reductase with GAF domain
VSGTDYCDSCYIAELEDAVRKARTEEIRIPFGVGIAGVVAQSKEIINIKDAYQVKLNLLICMNME